MGTTNPIYLASESVYLNVNKFTIKKFRQLDFSFYVLIFVQCQVMQLLRFNFYPSIVPTAQVTYDNATELENLNGI